MAIDRETQVLTEAYAAGIRSPRELANFMAQVTHESNGLNRLEESFRYTRGTSQIPTQAAWRDGAAVLERARKDALMGKPEPLAELMYGGRNGNDEPGDGWKYHGRGYIQLIGKDNYQAAGQALGMDLAGKPELAADPQHASRIAVWYWQNRLPEQARDDVKAATVALNGRYNGLDDRERRFDDWQRRLTPQVMERLASGHVGQPAPSQDEHARAAISSAPKAQATRTPDASGHAIDNALVDQARVGVHAVDAQHGRKPDQLSENLTGSLALAAKREGLTRIDHVLLSEDASKVYAVQGELNSPHKKIAEVTTAQAVNTPLEQSKAAMEQTPLRQSPAQEQEQAQQRPLQPGHGHG